MSDLEDDGPVVVARVNVTLIQSAADALQALRDRTGLKKVDIVNRAVQIFEFVDAEMRAGNDVLIQSPDGDVQRVKIL